MTQQDLFTLFEKLCFREYSQRLVAELCHGISSTQLSRCPVLLVNHVASVCYCDNIYRYFIFMGQML